MELVYCCLNPGCIDFVSSRWAKCFPSLVGTEFRLDFVAGRVGAMGLHIMDMQEVRKKAERNMKARQVAMKFRATERSAQKHKKKNQNNSLTMFGHHSP